MKGAGKKMCTIEIIMFSHFTQLELLQGAKDEFEWRRLDEYLKVNIILKLMRTHGDTQQEYIIPAKIHTSPKIKCWLSLNKGNM